MKLKLLVTSIAILMTTGGCVLHFPIDENQISLQSQDDSPPVGNQFLAPTEPNTIDHVKGNTAAPPN